MSTIAAISTAPGNAGIGIIRMSGKECFQILDKMFLSKEKLNVNNIKGYTMKYGYIIDSETREKIDEVIVSFFREPKSYTMENMCEINSHGGIIVEKRILEQCLKNGAELAQPGEFTKKAFLNGRIDLAQAEGIIELINSKTEKEAKASIQQLNGSLSNNINDIKSKLLDILSDVEAAIDYPEYDIEESTNDKIIDILSVVKTQLLVLEKSFNEGRIISEGIKTVIIGKPNTGKSSLLNNILKEERAIVSNIEGTTRDTIEEMIDINGIPLKIIDTAGIRDSNDIVEQIGINKAIKLSENADLIIAILDNSGDWSEDDEKVLNMLKTEKSIIVLNKIDLQKNEEIYKKVSSIHSKLPIVKMSTKTGEGIEQLYNIIENMFNFNKIEVDNGNIITNIRHKNQISKAIVQVDNSFVALKDNMPMDMVSICIKQILEELASITGDNVSEDIINKIFSKFCLGK